MKFLNKPEMFFTTLTRILLNFLNFVFDSLRTYKNWTDSLANI